MNFEIVLVGLAVHMLLWEHLPHWGNWFNWIIERLPAPLQYLYTAWRCPYCFGFWIALVGHLLTGIATLPAMFDSMAQWGSIGIAMGYFFDALASAVLIKTGKMFVSALYLPAINGHKAAEAFMAERDAQ